MTYDRAATFALVAEQLADDLACTPSDLASGTLVVVPAARRAGRRTFPFSERTVQVVTMGRGAVVSCDAARCDALRGLLADMPPQDALGVAALARLQTLLARDGQSLTGPAQHAVGWPTALRPAPAPAGVDIALLEGASLERVYAEPGFDNALEYSRSASRPDVLAATATVGGRVVGVAGVSADSARLWQIGVDVRAPFRGAGIAAALVRRAADAVCAAGRVPYYATALGNLTSARVALRVGFVPAWVAAYTRVGEATPSHTTEA